MKDIFKYFILLLLSTLSFNGMSQSWVWAKGAKGFGSTQPVQEGISIVGDKDGNLFFTGLYIRCPFIFGNDTLPFAPLGNIYLTKFDSNGNVLWSKYAKDSIGYTEWPSQVCVDNSGNPIIAGFFNSDIYFDSFHLVSPCNTSLFLTKYDSSGNVLWAKSAGTSGNNQITGESIDPLGNIIVVGNFSGSTIALDTITLSGSGTNGNMFVAKYDPNGNVMWARAFGNSYGPWANAVASDSQGNIYFTGGYGLSSITFDQFTLPIVDLTYLDAFVVKMSSEGNVIWANNLGGDQTDRCNSISVDGSANVFVTGISDSHVCNYAGNFSISNPSLTGAFVLKLDSSGNALWGNCIYDDGYIEGYSIINDKGGNVYVSGRAGGNYIHFQNQTDSVPVPNGPDPMFLAKYDGLGNLLCSMLLKSGGDDENSLWADTLGNVYIGGDFYLIDPFILGSDTLQLTTGVENSFLAKYNCGCSEPTISGSSNLCYGDSVSLLATGGLNYYWNINQNTWGINVSPQSNTIYSVIVSSGFCIDTISHPVTVNPLPAFTASNDTTLLVNSTATLSVTGNGSYIWSPSFAVNCDTCQTVSISPQTTTIFCVMVSDMNACRDSICIVVTVNSGNIHIPSILFGSQQIIIQGLELNSMLEIFDDRGRKVFVSNDYQNDFSPYYFSQGIYLVRLTRPDGEVIKQKLCIVR